eukprot:scaffold6931_cov443-Prasinococcus_capsulatus_cf.AAC.2
MVCDAKVASKSTDVPLTALSQSPVKLDSHCTPPCDNHFFGHMQSPEDTTKHASASNARLTSSFPLKPPCVNINEAVTAETNESTVVIMPSPSALHRKAYDTSVCPGLQYDKKQGHKGVESASRSYMFFAKASSLRSLAA